MDTCTGILSDDKGESLIHREMDQILKEGYAKSKTYDYESEASNYDDSHQGSNTKSKSGTIGCSKSSESKH